MTSDYPHSAAVVPRLEHLSATGSTNADLRAHTGDIDGWPHFSVIVTRNQTAGRGRLDRRWVAPDGAALAVSVLLRRLPVAPEVRGWVPLLAGLSMAEAVAAQLPEHDVTVKWPNDVLVDGRKICGILAEATADAVIVGAGVNTAMTSAQLPVPTATSFGILGVIVDEDELLRGYLRAMGEYLSALTTSGDAVASGLHAAMERRCGTIGNDVRVSLPSGGALDGTATGIDPEGRLVVDTAGVVHAVSAGDVVHVRPV